MDIKTKKKIIIILLFPFVLMTFAICNGFFLDTLLESIIRKMILPELGIIGPITVISAIAEFALMHGLLSASADANYCAETKRHLSMEG